MTPQEFIAKWRRNRGQESAGAQEWFLDLCRVVEHPTPAEMDRSQQWYTFERSVREASGRLGRADVYKQGYFAWEFKGLHRDLDEAYRQLQRYRESLNNPPLLVVSDFQTIRVHTNFTNKVTAVHTIRLEDLSEPESLAILRSVFHNPNALEPEISPEQVTETTASIFGEIARSMRQRDIDSLDVARFLNRLVFCFFAQDIGLLPERALSRLIAEFYREPALFDQGLRELLHNMNAGGQFGFLRIRHFNGDLFKEPGTVLMIDAELEKLVEVSHENWAHIEPSILGTLFERVIDPEKQGLVGAQYTSEADIKAVITSVMMRPLLAELANVESRIYRVMQSGGPQDAVVARRILSEFQSKLSSLRVLDPACGSGNFLYVALRQLRDLEKETLTIAANLGLSGFLPEVSPEQFYGIEIDPYASGLAYTALWIGHLQWSIENGYRFDQEPVLGTSNTIVCRDAIVDLADPEQPTEPEWPTVDYIVGNPPFLGHFPFREQLGDRYVNAVYDLYGDRLPNSSDLCCYWLEKARAQIADGKASRAGLLATQAIRFQSNRPALERIKETGDIFEAVSDQDWVLDGANVHISIICFDDGSETTRVLDGELVNNINPDLTAGADLTQAKTLAENAGISFMGVTKIGPFEIENEVAQAMLNQPNVHSRPNSDVIKRWLIGRDINQVSRDMWIIDFGTDMSEEDAALYQAPFEYVKANVKPSRDNHRESRAKENWWLHGRPRGEMRDALAGLERYIGTSMVSQHRIFAWIDCDVLPENTIIAFASDDDDFFGVLQSRPHMVWASAIGTQLESRPRYTPTTCFETFPFPEPTDEQREAIATAAAELNQLRENWRNPTDMFGNPALNADQLRRRTLTNLYNEYPSWLAHAHATLDAAVADAYGWPADLADDEVLERLLALNLARSEAE
ncbi:MAG: class I SAM-dependent DNA methyltransferase [Chloroflexi bacterium]|nr:class I SAM-dependent DNA methyltransferase [Chloroflexota bacterium]